MSKNAQVPNNKILIIKKKWKWTHFYIRNDVAFEMCMWQYNKCQLIGVRLEFGHLWALCTVSTRETNSERFHDKNKPETHHNL